MNKLLDYILLKLNFSRNQEVKIRSVKFLDFSVLKFTFKVNGNSKFLILINDYKEHYKEYGKINLLESNHTMTEIIATDIILSNQKEWKDMNEF